MIRLFFVLTALVALAVGCEFGKVRVAVTNMEPTFRPGDLLTPDYRAYRRTAPQRGDIVLYRPPGDPEEMYLSRVVAAEGDRLEIADEGLTIRSANGQVLCEPLPLARVGQTWHGVVPSAHVFLVGDKPAVSFDSRYFGPVHYSNVLARIAEPAKFSRERCAENRFSSQSTGQRR